MRIVLPFVLEKLKQQVLTEAGIKVVSPGDCRFLSARISGKTNKQISDTTLKRIYGFTFSKFLPSLYTLNILAEYCGYEGWEKFCQNEQAATVSDRGAVPEQELCSATNQTLKVSQRTLQSLVNRSVIPFKLTVKRAIVQDQLNLFLHSGQTATVITAPAGYGKTVSLCHWVQEQLCTITNGGTDRVLFLSSKVLSTQTHAGSLHDWLKAMMGMSVQDNDFSELPDEQDAGKMFYLVIDGFDKERFKPGEFELMTDLLMDLIASYTDHPNFKIILSMRPANWVSVRNRLVIENQLDNWFLGFMQDKHEETNLPLFSAEELEALSRKINPAQDLVKNLNPEVISFFSYPLFLQYYYQKHVGKFCLNKLDYFGIYDVISSYYLDKIYNSSQATEKVLVIKILLDSGSVLDGQFVVNKLRVYEELKGLWDAYNELISIGFLREVNRSIEGGYFKYIEFAHKRLLTYAQARTLVFYNNGKHDGDLIDRLNATVDSAYRVPVLKWCIFNAIKVQQFGIFKHITKVNLRAADKIHLLKFLIQLIQHKYIPFYNTDPVKFTFCKRHQDLFFYFFGVEFLSPEYEEILERMLSLDLEDTSKIWVHTCLGILGIVQLNGAAIEKSIAALRQFPEQAFYQFSINPLFCIETIYSFFKHGFVRREALRQITHFCFNPPGQEKFSATFSSDHILYLLALSTTGVSDNKHKLLRFVKVLKQRYLAMNNTADSTFMFFLQVSEADALLTLGKVPAGTAVYNELMENFVQNKHTYTPYMQICLDLVSAKVMALQGREVEAEAVIENVMQLSAKLKFHYIEAYTIAGYLAMPDMDTSSDFYKNINHRFMKLVRSGGFNLKSFLMEYKGEVTSIAS
ncbi:hypothetical protein KHS38_05615 [Mucilaginibacter sp. Bleaf8]|uniref:hypothetical protein n=1 Tax=Mucilaginibacter sp. Bleaf8 TaxID=2834430 RepID=UPI001BCCDD9D|nr:hypothetical protein [Mucilaginibacter sp. Bleaf8]MBS7563875.1 hypothetical protein [Mucilaginibacter sp. Bleaf8]